MLILTIFALFALIFAAPNKFVHPGVLVDANRLKLIRNNLNREPFKSAFKKALDSPIGDKSYKPEGPPSNGIIECGSYSKPDKGCSDEGHDGAAAYLQMILYALTDDPVYAKNAVNILNAYGKKLKAYTNSNAPLQAGWGSGKWARAAELAKHLPGVNWAANDIAAFEKMVRNVQIPFLINGATTNGNWELSKLAGLIGYGVFLDDKAIFDKAVQMWIERTPAYIYNVRDGNQPKKAPRGDPDWYGQEEFSARTSGHSQETCRDLRHTMFGIADMINVAETAYIQGIDLFSKEAARISQGLEYNAKIMLGSGKVDKYICGGKVEIMRDPTFEIGYNAYANRLGIRLPNTLEYIKKYTRTDEDPRENHMIVYETLTHGTP